MPSVNKTETIQLNQWQSNEYLKMDDFNSDNLKIDNKFKVHDTQLNDMDYQIAGGTATAITLTMQTLRNGYAKTFVASASNSGTVTTINGKKLYKPNTTIAPNLITGKAYTVWYNTSGDCFFIKASAEGTALASHVLKDMTFSNDNDTGIKGTLDLSNLVTGNIKAGVTINGVQGKSSVVDTAGANLATSYMLAGASGYANGSLIGGSIPNHSGADSVANSIAGTGVGRIYVRPQYGYYDGSVASYVDDSNFMASNIVNGKSIFGLIGSAKRVLSGSQTFTNATSTGGVNLSGIGFTPSGIFGYVNITSNNGSAKNVNQPFYYVLINGSYYGVVGHASASAWGGSMRGVTGATISSLPCIDNYYTYTATVYWNATE